MSLPPGPSSHALVQTWQWIRSPYAFLEDCAARFGETFQMTLSGFGTAVVVSNPDDIKEVFAASPDVLLGGKSNAVLRPFVGSNSLLILDGSEHQRQRKLLMPSFHGERMQAYGQTMLDLADAAIDAWPLQQTLRLHPEFQAITLRVILRTILGVAEGDRLQRLYEEVRNGVEVASNPLLLFPFAQRDLGAWSPWGKFKRMSNTVDEMLRQEIDERRQRGGAEKRTDILSMLLQARDESGEPMTFQELRDELVTMVVAGHETTATALGWTICALAEDPELWARLRQEIATAVEGDRLVPERVARLELLDATVREGLRLWPVAPMTGRVVQKPLSIGGYDIPAGWVVAPAVYLAHRRPAAFPEPARFRPERFLHTKHSPGEWLPFGGGNRRCIGAAFATYEMKMVLAAMVARTALRLEPGYVPRPHRRGVTLAPAKGVPVRLHERRDRSAISRDART
ncbi:MAG: cytochrome P450 [Polyangia bacterium]